MLRPRRSIEDFHPPRSVLPVPPLREPPPNTPNRPRLDRHTESEAHFPVQKGDPGCCYSEYRRAYYRESLQICRRGHRHDASVFPCLFLSLPPPSPELFHPSPGEATPPPPPPLRYSTALSLVAHRYPFLTPLPHSHPWAAPSNSGSMKSSTKTAPPPSRHQKQPFDPSYVLSLVEIPVTRDSNLCSRLLGHRIPS